MHEEITKLHKTIAAQAAVIEKLREGLKVAGMNCVDDFIAAGALQLADTIPTDSTQILDEVRRAEREKVIERCIELGAIERDGLLAALERSLESFEYIAKYGNSCGHSQLRIPDLKAVIASVEGET